MEDKIRDLKYLIYEFESEKIELRDMCNRWEDGDSMSDLGLQYEQESKIKSVYNKIKEFTKTL